MGRRDTGPSSCRYSAPQSNSQSNVNALAQSNIYSRSQFDWPFFKLMAIMPHSNTPSNTTPPLIPTLPPTPSTQVSLRFQLMAIEMPHDKLLQQQQQPQRDKNHGGSTTIGSSSGNFSSSASSSSLPSPPAPTPTPPAKPHPPRRASSTGSQLHHASNSLGTDLHNVLF